MQKGRFKKSAPGSRSQKFGLKKSWRGAVDDVHRSEVRKLRGGGERFYPLGESIIIGLTRREKSGIHAPATHTRTPRARAPPPLTAHLALVEEAGGKKSLPRPPLAAAQLQCGGRSRARHPSETAEAHAASFGGERPRAKSLHFGLFLNPVDKGGGHDVLRVGRE